jgi:hypothetical protein
MRTGFSRLTLLSVVLCSSLVSCADDSNTNKQTTVVQASSKKPDPLALDEIDLLAECHGEEEFWVDTDSGDESDRFLFGAYRQAAANVPMGQRQRYEERMKSVMADLGATVRDLDQSTDVDERRRYRSKLFGAEAENRWDRCDTLMSARFPKIEAEMIAKARALEITR